jgi:hypothetical protein
VRRWLAAHHEPVLLALILAAGAALRFYGLDWDGGHWLHPDERQIYFVTLSLGWPHSLAEALSPDSPLNPRFFAYGSLPLYLLKTVAVLLAPLSSVIRDPDNLHLIGRPLAALFDLGTVYLTYRLARIVLSPARSQGGQRGGAPFAAAFASVAVLSIQLAHFYTADTLLTFFVMLTLVLAAGVARGAGPGHQIALGAALGLALATKISAIPLLLVVLVAHGNRQTADSKQETTRDPSKVSGHTPPTSGLMRHASRVALTLAAAVVVLFLAQPYAFLDWQTFLADTIRESQIAWGALDVPYTRQYTGTLPYVYTIWQTALWGLGLPLGVVAWTGLGAILVRWLRRGAWTDTLLLAWAGPYLALVGLFHARYLRYMLPLVPVLCIVAAQFLSPRVHSLSSIPRHRVSGIGYWILVVGTLVYSVAFASIYAAPHSWISASKWIYRNVTAGSTLAVEDWDTALPLPLDVDGQARRISDYEVRALALYKEPDDADKWATLAKDLSDSDYVIIASRRLYGSILRLPDRYPLTSRYYEELFAGNLGFSVVGEFTRGPTWLNPRLPPLPDAASALFRPDESFVVYDHPRTLVFRNVEHLPAEELLRRLSAG